MSSTVNVIKKTNAQKCTVIFEKRQERERYDTHTHNNSKQGGSNILLSHDFSLAHFFSNFQLFLST